MTSQYIISTSLQLLPMFTSQTVPNFFHLSLLKELPQFGHDDAYMMSEDNFLVPTKKSDYWYAKWCPKHAFQLYISRQQ